MTSSLDTDFGSLRPPARVDDWEARPPDSLSVLDEALGKALRDLEIVVQHTLFRSAARATNYLWVMDGEGTVRLAVEELAVQQPEASFSGYPRRRGYRHPSEEKKLGHPTLLRGGEARIAGELAFDEIDGRLRWVFNANSGRYCRDRPPSENQVRNVARMFEKYGLDLYVDLD